MLTVASSRLEDPNVLLNSSPCIGSVIWWVNGGKNGNIDTEWLVGEFTGLSDGMAKSIW